MHLSLIVVFLIWVAGFGTFSIILKNNFIKKFSNSAIPAIIGYYILLTPIILLEEALTIETPYFWGIIPMILVFYSFFLILFLLQMITHWKSVIIVFICGFMGWANEFLVVGRIKQMNGLVLIIMSILCWLIYAVMAILPSAYLQSRMQK